LPVAEEIGIYFKEKIGAWRVTNTQRIIEKAKEKYEKLNDNSLHAHPRLVWETLEKGSWHDSSLFQDVWAGLLVSSCSKDGVDDSNLIFIDLLSKLTGAQVRLLNYACEKVEKIQSEAGWPWTKGFSIPLLLLKEITFVDDVHRLDREMDHLRSLDLFGTGVLSRSGGFSGDSTDATIWPSPLALHLYVRCQGFMGSPIEYWNIKKEIKPELKEKTASGSA